MKGFSDENFNYDKFDPRYKAKNARFDSLEGRFLLPPRTALVWVLRQAARRGSASR